MLHESTTLNYDLHAAKLLSNSLQTGRAGVVLDCPYMYHQDDCKTTARGFFITVPLNGAEVADKGDQDNLQEHSDGSARAVCIYRRWNTVVGLGGQSGRSVRDLPSI